MFSRVKLLLTGFCWSAALLHSSYGGPNDLWRKDIEALKLVQGSPRSIRLWNDQIVVELGHESHPSVFYAFKAESTEPKMLAVPNMDQIVSLGDFKGSPVALGKSGGHIIIVENEQNTWKELPVLPEFQTTKDLRIIPSISGLALLSEDRLFRFVNGKWLTPSPLPDVPQFYREFKPEKWGMKQMLYGSQLFVGWNHGEWGGMVALLDVEKPQPKWEEVSGKKMVTSLGIIGNDPVTGMTLDDTGTLWISEGSCHMGGMWRGLFRYGSKWTTMVRGSFDKSQGGMISFPGETTDIVDVFEGPDKKLYVLAGKLGIFIYEDLSLKPQISIDFYDITKVDSAPNSFSATVPCYPDGLVVDSAGNMFVATGYYGVLSFLKTQHGYQLKQIDLPDTKE
jgi:hypothetical protein